MTQGQAFPDMVGDFAGQVQRRIEAITAMAAAGGLDEAIRVMTEAIEAGGVLHAFGTGHSEAFAMEIAGRAGGLIPTNKIALRDLVLRGSLTPDVLGGSGLERDPTVADQLWDLSPVQAGDVVLIASNSGVNGSIVGLALRAKAEGHPVIAVTSLLHTAAVEPKHASGRRLRDVADVVIDNLAPYGDATLHPEGGVPPASSRGVQGGSSPLPGPASSRGVQGGSSPLPPVGAVSSITSAYIAQLLTIGVAERISSAGRVPPLYLSANIPGGDDHNRGLEDAYAGRISRTT